MGNEANKKMMSRSAQQATSDITTFKLSFAGFRGDSTEKGFVDSTISESVLTITCSIEYPAGVFKRVTFSGAHQAPGGNPNLGQLKCPVGSGATADGYLCWSDWVTLAIPKGAWFWVRHFTETLSGAGGIFYNGSATNVTRDTANGDLLNVGVSAADMTMGGTIPQSISGTCAGPALIVGPTVEPSVALVGDSIMWGQNHYDPSFRVGIIGTSIPTAVAIVNLGSPGATPSDWYSKMPNRSEAIPYVSHMVNNLGINAVSNAASLNAVVASRFAPEVRKYLCTLTPRSSSTDAWGTEASQNSAGYAPNNLAYNAQVRAGVAGYDAYIETCRGWMEGNTLDSYVWRVDAGVGKFTGDGLHPNVTANVWGRDQGKIPLTLWNF
jgi:hypothetical protein